MLLLSTVIFAITVLLILQDFRKSTDVFIENICIQARGELKPDTNIIIIHFSEEDIAQIGPWPIKEIIMRC